jgi:hypothetical protein
MRSETPLGRLEAIVLERMHLECRQEDLVLEAREEGWAWRDIGNALQRTPEAVRKRYGKMES